MLFMAQGLAIACLSGLEAVSRWEVERRHYWRSAIHDLRHTAATLLLGKGVHPKVVSELLGHSQLGVTLDLYSHVTPTMHRQAVTTFDELLRSEAVNLAVKRSIGVVRGPGPAARKRL